MQVDAGVFWASNPAEPDISEIKSDLEYAGIVDLVLMQQGSTF